MLDFMLDFFVFVGPIVLLIAVGMILQYLFGTRFILKAHEGLDAERKFVAAAKEEYFLLAQKAQKVISDIKSL